MNELILTDEQKRFWSQENWKNLRVHGNGEIESIYIQPYEVHGTFPVYIKYFVPAEGLKDVYCYRNGFGDSTTTPIVTEIKPKTMVPWGKKEWIDHRNCLFREPEFPDNFFVGLKFITDDAYVLKDSRWRYGERLHEYSPDNGVTWLPCMKEVPNE